ALDDGLGATSYSMQSLDRAGKLGSARTSVRDSECGVPDSGFKGAVIFQKIREYPSPGRSEGSSELGSDKKSTNARKTSYSTDVGVLPFGPRKSLGLAFAACAYWRKSSSALVVVLAGSAETGSQSDGSSFPPVYLRRNFPHSHLVGRIGDQQRF